MQYTTLDFFDNIILGRVLTKVMQFAPVRPRCMAPGHSFGISEGVIENGHQVVIIFGRHMLVTKA